MSSIKDIHNTTSQPLAISSVFTGIGRNLIDNQFASILINCFADKDGSLDVQFSSDGTSFSSFRVYQIKANKKRKIVLDVEDLFYRLVYTNGSTAQTIFNLESYLLMNQSSEQHNREEHYSYHNSTTNTLGASSVFTGQADDCSQFSSVSVAVNTDQNGTLDVQFSEDNSNWYFTDPIPITGGTPFIGNLECKARYCRVVYTNGVTSQTVFHLSTNYKTSHVPRDDIEVNNLPTSLGQTTMSNSLPIVIASDQSNLNTNVQQIPVVGSHGNAWNAAAIVANDTSTAVDLQYVKNISIFGNTTGSDEIILESSQDNTNWYNISNSIFGTGGDFYMSVANYGPRYMRLKLSGAGSAQTITASIVGK